ASRSGNNLVLSIAGTTDQVVLEYFFYRDDPNNAYNPIQQVEFADGTTWDIPALTALALSGTAGDDSLMGTVAGDVIHGQAGADTLYGRDGDDTLLGGTGNDRLLGEYGNDILDGGAGNDYLAGAQGNDTYLFGKGDGQAVIASDHDTTIGQHNVLRFKDGVAASEVLASRSGNNLVLSIAGTTDQVVLEYFFYRDDPNNAYNPIQQVEFADGTIWDIPALTALAFSGTAGD